MKKWQSALFVVLIVWLSFHFVNVVKASDYCVSGAGTAGVDGGYTLSGLHSEYDHDGATDFRLVFTGYYELRSGANPYLVPATTDLGYYYDSAGAGGSFLTLDTVNGDGAGPVPTVVSGDCASPTPTPTPYATSTSEQILSNIFFGEGLILVLMFTFGIGAIWNAIHKKQ